MPYARPIVAASIVLTALVLWAMLDPARADETFFPITRAPEARFLPVAQPRPAAGQIVPGAEAHFFPIRPRAATGAPVGIRPGAPAAAIRADRGFLGLPDQRAAPPAAEPAAQAPGHLWPVDRAADSRVSSRFGWRADPFTGARAFHGGIDIAAPAGTPAVATAPARVKAIGEHPRLGRYVMLAYADGAVATYGHLHDFAVGTGDVVARGERVGTVGSTGRSTGPHLDFAFELAGRRIDPLTVLEPPPMVVAGR